MTSLLELQSKLELWQYRLRTAKTAALRDVALAHASVYIEVLERRTPRFQLQAGLCGDNR